MDVAEQLKQAREAAGLSQRAVARHVQRQGVPLNHSWLCNIESGARLPTAEQLVALCDLYDLPLHPLVRQNERERGDRRRGSA